MRNSKIVVAVLCLVLWGGGLAAEGTGWTSAVVEYFDDVSQLTVLDAQGKPMDSLYMGLELLANDTIKTGNTSVELRLVPGGSLIRLSPNTKFRIDALPTPKSEENSFNLAQGKIRVIAQKSKKSNYTFRTPTAVAGVRGTEFGIEVDPGKTDKLVVRTGIVEYTKLETQATVVVTEKQVADTFAPVFKAEVLEVKKVEEFFTNEDIEAEKRDAEKFASIQKTLDEERMRKANEAALATDAKKQAEKVAEEERVKAAKEEEERLAEIRKAGALAVAAEAERQKERDRMAKEAAVAEELAKAEAERLKVQFMKGLIYLEGGSFYLGDRTGQGQRNETPARKTTVSGFYLGQNVVTVGEFRRFAEAGAYRTTAELKRRAYTNEGGMWAERMARNWRFPGYKPGPADPVRCISWYDAVAYCNWLSVDMGKSPAYKYEGRGTDVSKWPAGWNKEPHNRISLVSGSNGFRLPGEKEWEFAAEGGVAQTYTKRDVNKQGFSRLMFVSEWVNDLYGEYDSSNGFGASGTTSRVIRGLVGMVFGPSVRDRFQPDYAADNVLFRVCLPPAN